MLTGYEEYGQDTTPDEREVAETLEERVYLKAQKGAPDRVGQKISWLVRLVRLKTSWVRHWMCAASKSTATITKPL